MEEKDANEERRDELGDTSGVGNGVLLVEGSMTLPNNSHHNLESIEEFTPLRFLKVEGWDGRRNDILYARPSNPHADDEVLAQGSDTTRRKRVDALVFFAGDIQDFKEIMEASRDHHNYLRWTLEVTAKLLQAQFPNHHIVIIRPSKTHMYFSCFENFVPGNETGCPDHTPNHYALQHLEALLRNLSTAIYKHSLAEAAKNSSSTPNANVSSTQAGASNPTSSNVHRADEDQVSSTTSEESEEGTVGSATDNQTINTNVSNGPVPASSSSPPSTTAGGVESSKLPNLPPPPINLNLDRARLSLVGFSKGCVVLNQFLYEFHYLKTLTPDDDTMDDFLTCVEDLYWLDGGHNGGKNSWITSRSLLETLIRLGIRIHVHVTPYQLLDDGRAWIRKEEKMFSDMLHRSGAPFSRKIHFEHDPPSLDFHLKVLTRFGAPEANEILNQDSIEPNESFL